MYNFMYARYVWHIIRARNHISFYNTPFHTKTTPIVHTISCISDLFIYIIVILPVICQVYSHIITPAISYNIPCHIFHSYNTTHCISVYISNVQNIIHYATLSYIHTYVHIPIILYIIPYLLPYNQILVYSQPYTTSTLILYSLIAILTQPISYHMYKHIVYSFLLHTTPSSAKVSFNLIYNKYTNLIFILFHLHLVYVCVFFVFNYSVILFYFMIPKLKLQSQPIEVWFSVCTLNKKLADCLSLCATLVGYIHSAMHVEKSHVRIYKANKVTKRIKYSLDIFLK